MFFLKVDVLQLILYFGNQCQCCKNKPLRVWLAAFDKRVLQRLGSRVCQILYACCLWHVASFPIAEDFFGQ